MIRLIYGKKIKKDNKNFQFTDDPYIYKQEDLDNIDAALNNAPSVKTYREFLKQIEKTRSEYLQTMIFIEFDTEEKTFFVFKKFNNKLILVSKYEPENDMMLDFCKKLFVTEKKTSTNFEMSAINNFTFITDFDVLDLLFTNEYLNSIGEKPFTTFKLTSKNGKVRDIVAPHNEIKKILSRMNEKLQKTYDKRNSKFQVAYKKGKSIKTGALLHTNHKYVYNIDLKDFYPSCKKELVKKYTDFLFAKSFNRDYVENKFFDIILKDDGLFIGSPISGTLANTIISLAVAYMNNICKKFNMYLSVYADDISFSSDTFIKKETIISIFDTAFAKHGLDGYFKINEKKCVGYSGHNRKVTGVSINGDNKVTVSRRYYRELRAAINNLAHDNCKMDLRTLRGKIAYAMWLDDSGKISRYIEKYKDTLEKYNLYPSRRGSKE